MTTVKTDLGNTRESARRLRVEPIALITQTNVQKALEQISAGGVSTPDPIIAAADTTTAIPAKTAAVAVQGVAPTATGLTLPAGPSQGGIDLHIYDASTSAVDHAITITPAAGQTVMGQATWVLYSTTSSLAGVTLRYASNLSDWYIAP